MQNGMRTRGLLLFLLLLSAFLTACEQPTSQSAKITTTSPTFTLTSPTPEHDDISAEQIGGEAHETVEAIEPEMTPSSTDPDTESAPIGSSMRRVRN